MKELQGQRLLPNREDQPNGSPCTSLHNMYVPPEHRVQLWPMVAICIEDAQFPHTWYEHPLQRFIVVLSRKLHASHLAVATGRSVKPAG